MDMEDPWGSSPWAEETQHSSITTKDNDQVGPETSVNASTLGLEVKADSPWGDSDNGFGDWATVPATEVVKSNEQGFDGANDAWETRDGTRIHSELNALNSNWNDSIHISQEEISTSKPNFLPKPADVLRQRSPDPWSTAFSSDDPPAQSAGIHHDREEAELGERNVPGPKDILDGTETRQELLTETITPVLMETTEDFGLEPINLDDNPPEYTQVSEEVVHEHGGGHESSRPSSSPSDQSHHDAIVETPRTSLDEAPRRLQTSRKVSTKIQELVEHFDGLAKQEEEVLTEPSRSLSRSTTPLAKTEQISEETEVIAKEFPSEPEDDDDFGDFEEGQSDVGEPVCEVEVTRPLTTMTVPSHASSPASKIASPRSQVKPSRIRYKQEDYGRVEYHADMDAVKSFTAPADSLTEAPVEKIFIMDTIPYDSFKTSEERKTWYRVSRYGSMRKHISGDDENYLRVTWPKSQIRDETLKTVARWLEEDRISGRVVLGGGRKGSSVFGWGDPKGPAVPLDSVFADRRGKKTTAVQASIEAAPEVPREWPKGLVRDRSNSKGRSSPKAKKQSSSKSVTNLEIQEPIQQIPVANFGWNANHTTTSKTPLPLQDAPFATPLDAPFTPERPASPQLSVDRSSNPPDTRRVAKTLYPNKLAEGNRSGKSMTSEPTEFPSLTTNFDEDDDWGEMMASPVINNAPVLPPLQGLRHKKSQSLSGAFSPPSEAILAFAPADPTPVRGHRSTISFDDILVPQPRSSLDAKVIPVLSAAQSLLTQSSVFTPTTQTSQVPPVAMDGGADPWASADFSFFDSLAPVGEPAVAASSQSKPVVLKSVALAKALPAPSPLRHGKTKQEIEQDEIVAEIVKSLPDLSYMFRR